MAPSRAGGGLAGARSARAPSYEQVAREHVYPEHRRDSKRWELAQKEVGLRFLRSALFLTPQSCFTEYSAYDTCCVQPHRRKTIPAPGWCFDEVYTAALCCGKQRFWKHLLTPFPNRARNSTDRSGPPLRGLPGCQALRALRRASLVAWLEGLLVLSSVQQAACAAGSLAPRLLRASPAEALEALAMLRRSAEAHCPGRRALVTLRRNVMIWHHCTADSSHLPAGASDVLLGALQALERCRRALPTVPILHLHVPKTAGTSLCVWANSSGLVPAQDRGAPCFFFGDGPSWMGQTGVPASCKQRARENEAAGVSWTSVERWLDLPLCEGLRYSVALREPIWRMVHQFKHLLNYFLKGEMGSTWQGDSTSLTAGFFARLWRFHEVRRQLRNGTRGRDVKEDWVDLWLGFSSNYQVRSLAGAPAGSAFLEAPAAAARRLGAALQVLEQFDSVLVMGSGPLTSSQERLLRYNLEVESDVEVPFVSHTVSNASEGDVLPAYPWDPGELWEARAQNAADLALLERAQLLETLDRRYLVMVGLDA